MSYLHQFASSVPDEPRRWLDSTITGVGRAQRRELRWIAVPRGHNPPEYECTPQAVRGYTSGRVISNPNRNGLLTVNDRSTDTKDCPPVHSGGPHAKRRTRTARMNGRV